MSTTPGGTNYGEFRNRIPGAHPPIQTMSPNQAGYPELRYSSPRAPKYVHYVRPDLLDLRYRIPDAQALEKYT
jgi:hypothetical protein